MLASERGGGGCELAALRRRRDLGVERLRLVLAFELLLGLGAVPLWTMAPRGRLRLVLDAGLPMGACLGHLAVVRGALWVGSLAPQ